VQIWFLHIARFKEQAQARTNSTFGNIKRTYMFKVVEEAIKSKDNE
jgi:hypothetical protein